MFGGAGVYADGVMFALIAEDQLYLKTDDALREALEKAGGHPFIWVRPSDQKQIDMGYVSLPETALDDADEAVAWATKALVVAKVAKTARPPKRTRASEP